MVDIWPGVEIGENVEPDSGKDFVKLTWAFMRKKADSNVFVHFAAHLRRYLN